MSCNESPSPAPLGPEPPSKGLGVATSCLVIAISLVVCWIWPDGIVSTFLVGALISVLLQAQIRAWVSRQRRLLGLPAEEQNRPEPFTGRFSLMELIAIVMVAFLVIGFVFVPMLMGSPDQMSAAQADAERCLAAMVIVVLAGWTIRCCRRREWHDAAVFGFGTFAFLVFVLSGEVVRMLVLVSGLSVFGLDGLLMHRRWLAWVRATGARSQQPCAESSPQPKEHSVDG